MTQYNIIIHHSFKSFEIGRFKLKRAKLPSQLRLGHFVENQFYQCLREQFNDNYVINNIQIIDDKITSGELDFLITRDGVVSKHIEFCYKFYLYDPKISSNEFECWIGPNRRDSLKEKIFKLETKQLPLLHKKETIRYLRDNLKLALKNTKQEICFLAELFVSYEDYKSKRIFKHGTPQGFYINISDLGNFLDLSWFIPNNKLEWLFQPQDNELWRSTEDAKQILTPYHFRDSNPLCFVKEPSGRITKCFVVNW